MYRFSAIAILLSSASIPAFSQTSNPFLGRWDFTNTRPGGVGANWLGVTGKNGNLEVWFQPTGGHVYQVKDFKLEGSHLTLNLPSGSGNRPAADILPQ